MKPVLLMMPRLFSVCIVACISEVTMPCRVRHGGHVRADFQNRLHPDFVTGTIILLSIQAHTPLHSGVFQGWGDQARRKWISVKEMRLWAFPPLRHAGHALPTLFDGPSFIRAAMQLTAQLETVAHTPGHFQTHSKDASVGYDLLQLQPQGL